jgi:hypothetical protein
VLYAVVQGAIAAGMKVVAVPSMVSLEEEEFKVMRPSDDGQAGTAGGKGLVCFKVMGFRWIAGVSLWWFEWIIFEKQVCLPI